MEQAGRPDPTTAIAVVIGAVVLAVMLGMTRELTRPTATIVGASCSYHGKWLVQTGYVVNLTTSHANFAVRPGVTVVGLGARGPRTDTFVSVPAMGAHRFRWVDGGVPVSGTPVTRCAPNVHILSGEPGAD
jgi:hypothetical protein